MPKLLQNSFATEDALAVMKYRDIVDKGKEIDWEMVEMIDASVGDGSWIEQWDAQMKRCQGVLIVYTEAYRTKCAAHPNAPLLKEARLIKQRMQRDKDFQVFVLDPTKPGQDGNGLFVLLLRNKQGENSDGWLKWLEKTEGAVSGNTSGGSGYISGKSQASPETEHVEVLKADMPASKPKEAKLELQKVLEPFYEELKFDPKSNTDLTSYLESCCHVYLRDTGADDTVIKELARGCPNLTYMNLEYCSSVTDSGVKELAAHCPQLNVVNLRHTAVTDSGVQELARGCPNLKEIYLIECSSITDSGVKELARGCPNLNKIFLNHCSSITDSGVKELAAHCPQLKIVGLARTAVTDSGVKEIKRMLPKCIVED